MSVGPAGYCRLRLNQDYSRDELVTAKIPRPNTIWVHDFAATPADVPDESAFAGQYSEHSPPQTAKEIAMGRQLGDEIASQLIEQINAMGMPAEHAVTGTTPQINDLVIQGYLISFNKGSAAKRILIGFGSGASDLKVAVEGFQMTAQGLRKLGTGKPIPEEAKRRGWIRGSRPTCHTQPGGTHHQQRYENLRTGEWQQHG